MAIAPLVLEEPVEIAITAAPRTREASRLLKQMPVGPKNSWLKDMCAISEEERTKKLYKTPPVTKED